MKILQLCKKFPYPLKDGESIAVTYLSQALAREGCELHLLSMNTTKHFLDLGQLPDDFDHYREIHTVEIDNKLNPFDAFINLFSTKSYHISRFESDRFADSLREILGNHRFDVILLETLFLTPYLEVIRSHSKGMVVMRAHNVEHEIWERISENTGFWPKRWYLKYLSQKLKKFEIDHLNEYDYLVPISDADLNKFRKLGFVNGARAIPIGLDVDLYSGGEIDLDSPLQLAFIGSLDWIPNQEGILWFLREVWPTLRSSSPDLTLHIAGRNTPDILNQIDASNVRVLGEVPDAKKFLCDHQVLVVPLLSGSGMRAKIIEGLALGRIVITTSLGLEGINAKHRKEVLIADTPAEFQKAISFCQTNKDEVANMVLRGREFVKAQYNSRDLARKLKESLDLYAAGPKQVGI